MKNNITRIAVANALAGLWASAQELPYDGTAQHNRITQANDVFDNAYYSEPLTGFATGVRDTSDLESALDFFCPKTQVAKRYDYLSLDPGDDFGTDDDDSRAPGEDFKSVKSVHAMKSGKVHNRGLRMVVDIDQVGDDTNWRERKTAQLKRRILRNRLRRAYALLSAAGVNTARDWTSAGVDADLQQLESLEAAANASGMMPNRVGYGATAYTRRVKALRSLDAPGGYANAGFDTSQLAGFLGVEDVHVNKSRYNDGSAKSQILGNEVISFYAANGLEAEDPSHIKCFWSPTEGGQEFRVYERQLGPKLYEITVECYTKEEITSTVGIRKETVS